MFQVLVTLATVVAVFGSVVSKHSLRIQHEAESRKQYNEEWHEPSSWVVLVFSRHSWAVGGSESGLQ